MRFQNKLNKKQLAHVKECCGGTLRGIREARAFHRSERERRERLGLHPESCFECRGIALKLGIEE